MYFTKYKNNFKLYSVNQIQINHSSYPAECKMLRLPTP